MTTDLLMNSEDFIYDGVNIREAMQEHGFLFIIQNTKGRGLLEQDANTVQVSGVDGSRLLDVTMPERVIDIDYTIKADDLISLRDAEDLLARLLVRETEMPLSFADKKGNYRAIYTGNSISDDRSDIQQGTLTFLCPNPFRLKDTIELTDIPYEADVPQEITVDANYYTEAVVDIELTGSATEVELKVNGSAISYSSGQSLPSGTRIVFDGQALECRVNGELKVMEVEGVFPLLKSNLNTITVNTASLMTIKYRERDI